jgi:uncharacterized protein HemY
LLEQAVAGLPNLPLVHYHLGMAYLKDGQKDKAAASLAKALELIANGGVPEAKVRAALDQARGT